MSTGDNPFLCLMLTLLAVLLLPLLQAPPTATTMVATSLI